MHSHVAADMLGAHGWKPESGENHPRRSEAKAITHGTTYGMGARRLAQTTGFTEDEVRQHLTALTQAYPQLDQFKKDIRLRAENTQVITNAFGRRMRVHPDSCYTQEPAGIGQGTARDLMAECLLLLPRYMDDYLRAIVHDEVVLSAPRDEVETVKRDLMTAFTFDFHTAPDTRPVRILADLSDEGRDWADMYRSEHPDWPEVSYEYRQTHPESITEQFK
ncbi:hypothetical protein KRX51_04845 [Corynebacterium sp. TAE3-ERU12]|nr:hypothetical protein [Corynebacterium sp. TAE3-ERU12]